MLEDCDLDGEEDEKTRKPGVGGSDEDVGAESDASGDTEGPENEEEEGQVGFHVFLVMKTLLGFTKLSAVCQLFYFEKLEDH